MIERDATAEDIFAVLIGAESCSPAAARWRLAGPDTLGEELVLIAELEAGWGRDAFPR